MLGQNSAKQLFVKRPEARPFTCPMPYIQLAKPLRQLCTQVLYDHTEIHYTICYTFCTIAPMTVGTYTLMYSVYNVCLLHQSGAQAVRATSSAVDGTSPCAVTHPLPEPRSSTPILQPTSVDKLSPSSECIHTHTHTHS